MGWVAASCHWRFCGTCAHDVCCLWRVRPDGKQLASSKSCIWQVRYGQPAEYADTAERLPRIQHLSLARHDQQLLMNLMAQLPGLLLLQTDRAVSQAVGPLAVSLNSVNCLCSSSCLMLTEVGVSAWTHM